MNATKVLPSDQTVRNQQRPLLREEVVQSTFENKYGGRHKSVQTERHTIICNELMGDPNNKELRGNHCKSDLRGNSNNNTMLLSERLGLTSPASVPLSTKHKCSQHPNRVQFRTVFSQNINKRIPPVIRPVSAPVRTGKHERKGTLPKSARGRYKSGTSTLDDDNEMFRVVQAAKEAKEFEEDAEYFRKLERSLQNPEGDEETKHSAPVFNKRLFASQGTVIITREARRLMFNNGKANEGCDLETLLTKSEIQCLRCVTEGLKLIHKGHDFVKDVLSRVISYEIYKAFEYVPSKHWEDTLACYYILNGAVEVTYDLRATESRNVFQANIIYSHGTGEYLGLVSSEGSKEDLAPPATIYTKELTQFIRIDRQRFHRLVQKATAMVDKRKRDYISSHSFLTDVADEVKEKILQKLTIQDYPANRVLLPQGEITEHLFIVMTGRCQTYREIYIPEADKEVLFYLTSRDRDDFFGEECVLDEEPSFCTIVTATASTCLKLHRSALKMVNKDKLSRFIDAARHEFPNDEELRTRGYKDSVWNKYKHSHIKGTLKEGGKMRYLKRATSEVVHERPPDEQEQYTENMRMFIMKGSQFEPMRVKSATVPKLKNGLPPRPQTASACNTAHYAELKQQISTETDEVDSAEASVEVDKPSSKLMTADKAKEMEKQIAKSMHGSVTVPKAMESKETLLKVLEDQGDLGSHLKQAWKAKEGQDMQNFMKNSVLVTMTSEDIVRKAKALADTYSDKWKHKMADSDEEEWSTILHAENKQSKMLITANRLRMKDLKRKMSELQKQREKTRLKYAQKKVSHINKNDQSNRLTMNGNTSDMLDTNSDKHKDIQTSQATSHDKDITDAVAGNINSNMNTETDVGDTTSTGLPIHTNAIFSDDNREQSRDA